MVGDSSFPSVTQACWELEKTEEGYPEDEGSKKTEDAIYKIFF